MVRSERAADLIAVVGKRSKGKESGGIFFFSFDSIVTCTCVVLWVFLG